MERVVWFYHCSSHAVMESKPAKYFEGLISLRALIIVAQQLQCSHSHVQPCMLNILFHVIKQKGQPTKVNEKPFISWQYSPASWGKKKRQVEKNLTSNKKVKSNKIKQMYLQHKTLFSAKKERKWIGSKNEDKLCFFRIIEQFGLEGCLIAI